MASRVIPFPKHDALPNEKALELVARLREGDERACLELLAHYAQQIWAYPMKRAGGARDWTDEKLDDWWGFVSPQLCSKFKTYRGEGGAPLGGWLATVLRTSLASWFKKKAEERKRGARLQAHVETNAGADRAEPEFETDRDRAARDEAVRSVFAGLTSGRRICLALPENPQWLTDEDIDALAKKHGLDHEATKRKIFELCRLATSDLDIIDLVYPPEMDAQRSPQGREDRQNAIQQNRSRARQQLKKALAELAR